MGYDQDLLDIEFRSSAMEAERCASAIERAIPGHSLSDHHDECLGRASVYAFLYARPFLRSRAAMLEELRWLRSAESVAPANAIDPNRFDASRYSLIESLIARFELPGLALV